jgi:hypothetical protein
MVAKKRKKKEKKKIENLEESIGKYYRQF